MRRTRIAALATAGALAAAGTGVAVATSNSDDAEQREDAVLADAAGRLDVDAGALRDALAAAEDAQLDAEVKAGRLTQAQADAIKKMRERSGLVLGGPGGHHERGFGFRGGHEGGPGEVMGAAAKPVAVAVATPLLAPTQVAAGAGPPRLIRDDQIGMLIGAGALLLLVLGAGAVFLIARTTSPRRVAAPATVAPEPNDRTVLVTHGGGVGDLTMLGHRQQLAQLPRAKLILGPGPEVSVPATSGLTIGRDAKSGVVLDDLQASRNHARIVYEQDAFWIEDLQSLNGTRVNGGPITRQKLESKDQIGVGDSVLTFVTEPN